jgi:ABC-type oligopeptide transport system substrate-binding subunit
VRSKRRSLRLLAVILGLALLATACGGDDSDDSKASGNGSGDKSSTDTKAGGDLIDLGTFVGDPPEHLDPALNQTLDAYQVINALYDGLTDIDSSDPKNPKIVPLVAESYSANDDASVWTFKIKPDAAFSDGEQITPTTFQRSWERAADLAGPYSYLLAFIKGGQDRLDGKAKTLAGVQADDATSTLTVTLEHPYSNFDAVAGFQLFFPVAQAAFAAGEDYDRGAMIGNGPYRLAKPRTDQEIDLVKNDSWAGDFNGKRWDDRLDTIEFKVSADPDTSYNSFEAGEGDTANVPPARVEDAKANHGTTADVHILGSYYYSFNFRKPEVGGPENKLFREAISQAIDRDSINDAVYNGSRTTGTGITPEGIPGFKAGLCEYCTYDKAAAQKAFDQWKAEGHSQSGPLKIQFNAGAGHEPVVQIIVDNLKAIGIQAEADPMPTETYFSDLSKGACIFCRVGWYADYPTYDNFMYDLFHTATLDGNNYGYSNEAFDKKVDEAKQTVDKDAQAKLFQEAEQILLNDDVMAVPINWYLGDYAYDRDKIAAFPQTNLGLVMWEQITLKA